MVLHALIVAILLSVPAEPYSDLGAALDAPEIPRRGLPEASIQCIIDQSGLGWATGWPEYPARCWSDVRGYVSYNREYCILSRAGAGEWGQGGAAEYCLVSVDSGVVWLRSGDDLVGAPRVSDVGIVALYNRGSPPRSSHPGVGNLQLIELTIVNVQGDTVVTKTWWDRYSRGDQMGFIAQEAGFSPQGRFFLQTMNLLDRDSTKVKHRDTTLLYWVDFAAAVDGFEELGRFRPKKLDLTEDGGILEGVWWDRPVGGEGLDEGFYRIQWKPWRIERIVTTSYPSTRAH
jgi:hypothetical protein